MTQINPQDVCPCAEDLSGCLQKIFTPNLTTQLHSYCALWSRSNPELRRREVSRLQDTTTCAYRHKGAISERQ